MKQREPGDAGGRLVLSPTPLSEERRRTLREELGEPVRFLDLSTLGRAGARGAWKVLRGHAVHEVVVTGSSGELTVFRDVLEVAGRVVPARVLSTAAPNRARVQVLRPAGLAAASILTSSMRALAAAFRNSLIAGPRFARRGGVAQLTPGPSRCLYLRPTLMFGEPVGGSVGHVSGVVNALRRRGHEVTVVAMFRQPGVDSSVEQVIVPPTFTSAYPNELNRHRFHAGFFGEAMHVATGCRPAFLYARYSLSDLSAVRLRRALGIPLVMEYNGSEVWVQEHWGQPLRLRAASERVERANLKEADLVVTVSEEIRQQVLALGVPDRRVLFYPNGVDPLVFDPARFDDGARRATRERLGVPGDADLFTFVGTFGHWHGTEILAAAIRKLIVEGGGRAGGWKPHFLFVGDGPLAPRVRAVLESEATRRSSTFAGYRPQGEAAEILAASDVFVSPHVPNADGSAFFGSPTKLFEYMAMARPIVASDLNQIGAVLRGWTPSADAGDSGPPLGILVEPGSVDSLAAGLALAGRLSPDERTRLGDAARQAVLRWFTWERNVEAVLLRLEELCATAVPVSRTR